MAQASAVEADIAIKGNVSGHVAVGNYNVQIQNSNGCVVNVAPPRDQPAYSMRPLPVHLRPRAFPSLLDRDREAESIKAAIQTSTPVSIFGEEGIGKTSFLRRLIHLPDLPSFPAGVVYLEVSGRGLEDLLQYLFDTFYESRLEFKPRDGEIRLALQKLKALVFLDGLNLARDEIVSLLDAAPDCTFMLSSVERSLWGEGQTISLQGLPENEALTLFQRELGRSMNEEELAAARKICALLQGHPLRVLQAAELVHEKSKPISELLEELQRESPEKAVLQVTLSNLTKHQKNVLALLAAAGGTIMPLEHLVSLSQDPDVRKALQGLIALGLVQAHSPRYSLTGDLVVSLPTLLDLSSWEDTLANYFITWLEGQPSQVLIEESADALIYTVKRAGEKQRWTEVIQLGRALERYLILWKRWQTWVDVLNLILKAAKALGDRKVEAWALHQLGSRAMCLGQADQARELLTEALNIRKAIRDKAGLKVTQHNLNILLRAPVPPKGGKPGGRPWFIGSSVMILAVLMAAVAAYVGLSLAVPPESLPFPGLPIYLFPTNPPAKTLTHIPTKTIAPTPSRTITPTDIFTPTPTWTRTRTKTPSRTPTPTRTRTPTPTTETQSTVVLTEIQKKYRALGGRNGFLGDPTGPETSTPDGYGRFRHFQGGSIYWTPDTGAYEVHGAILQKWESLGWERSDLGYPITDESTTPDGIGRYNHFQYGSIYWTPDTGAHEVHGAIREKWAQLGWERSDLGYPTTDEARTPDGIGRYNHFQYGSIYWTPDTGAHEVRGVIHAKWAELGWEQSWLGYPISDEEPSSCSGWTRESRFQSGIILWSAEKGAQDVGFCPPIIR